jgi:hypothetical protein
MEFKRKVAPAVPEPKLHGKSKKNYFTESVPRKEG